MTEISLQDGLIDLDSLTELQDNNLYRLIRRESKPLFTPGYLQGVTLQMNFDLTQVQRTGYTVLDLLSDIGGLQGILSSGITVILSIWNHNYLDSYLISNLFKTSKDV